MEDGGDESSTITWQAYPGETPVISSGYLLDGWVKSRNPGGLPPQAKGKVYETYIPKGSGIPRVLFKDESILRRSRSKGFSSRIDAFDRDGLGHLRSRTVMYTDDKAELKNWKNPGDLELVIRPFSLWTINILPVHSVNLKDRTITTKTEGTYVLTKERYNRFPDEHAWIENTPEGMTSPGTWSANSLTGKIYYWPEETRPGNNIYMPLLTEFIKVEGVNDPDGQGDIPVKNLVFLGIKFMHNERFDFLDTDAGIQHDWDLFDKDNAFFRFRGAENCVVEECEFTAGGGAGIRLDLYCQNILVQKNYIHNLGGTGIFLCGYGLGLKDVNKKNIITNNKITNVSGIFWHGAGLIITQSGENVISHNEISDLPYSGILMTGYRPWFMHTTRKEYIDGKTIELDNSWGGFSNVSGIGIRENSRSVRWEEIGPPVRETEELIKGNTFDKYRILKSFYPMIHNRMNIIEYNEIFDVMKVLGDGNGIYISDTGPFNVIRNNFIHSSPDAWGVGIRTDAFQMDTHVYGNIIWKFSGGIQTHTNNQAFNNIVAECGDAGQMEDPGKILNKYYEYKGSVDHFTDGVVMRNVIWHKGENPPYFGNDLLKGMERTGNIVDHNFYYWKNNDLRMTELLNSLQKLGIEKNGMVTDPMFSDPENGDFSLNPESPLLKNGFMPVNQKIIGLKGDFPEKFVPRQK